MGIPGSIFLSYGFSEEFVLSLGGLSFPFYIAVIPYYLFITFLSIVLCYYYIQSQKREKYTKALEILNNQLNEINNSVSNKIFSLENDSTNEERKRISKEIHDTAGYVFVNLIMMLQAASAVFNKDSKKAENLINDARDYAERGINEIRHILHEIRNYAPTRISLQNEMYNIGKAFNRATEVKVNINYGNWPQIFSDRVDSLFLLFIQESLTNALKHGHASSISISCWKNEHSHTITIADNGVGTTLPIKKGIGITALEDMVNRYNGYLIMRSDETGFSIQVLIPNDEL
jgi:signal transduction histidine kinase